MKQHDMSRLILDSERSGSACNGNEKRIAKSMSERGAAVIEFAIILPILLTLVFGIIEFGRGYEAKVQLTGGVREGARALALGQSVSAADQAVKDAVPGLDLASATFTNTSCPAGGADGDATVKVSYNLTALTPLIPSGSINLTATGVMRCGL